MPKRYKKDTIKLEWDKKNGHRIDIDVDDPKILKEMIMKVVVEFYPGAKVYHHGRAIRFKV